MNHKTKREIPFFLYLLYYALTKLLPIRSKVILFESNAGKNYSGNPKYIYEEMVNRGLDKKYHVIWILENTDTFIPGQCRKIKRLSVIYLYYLVIAKFWIADCRQPQFVIKREQTIYIQTWHGTPLKKLAMDMTVLNMGGEVDLDKYQQEFLNSTQKWDYLISQNSYSTDIFRSAFAFDKTVLEIGYPRNDFLINSDQNSIAELKSMLKLPKNKKIILYAPTWRDNQYYEPGNYSFNLNMDLELISKALKDDYIMILKVHYNIVGDFDTSVYDGFVHYFSAEQDIQQLYLVADILITDYSSVMFDYSLLKRPMIFYTYDLEKYEENIRGFYFNLVDEAPGPVVRKSSELLEAIQTIESDRTGKYKELYDNFVNRYNHLDDGAASAKIIELIESY